MKQRYSIVRGGIVILILALSISLSCIEFLLGSLLGGDDEEDTVTHQYLVIPGAQFHQGEPPEASSDSTSAQETVSATVVSGTPLKFEIGEAVTWKIDFNTSFTVKEIIIWIAEIDGYFVYPLAEPVDSESGNAGSVNIEMLLVEDVDEETLCQSLDSVALTCYSKADEGTTSFDFSASDGEATVTNYTNVELVIAEVTVEADTEETTATTDETAVEDSGTNCSDWTTTCSCNVRACSDGVQNWYEMDNGQRYYCNGDDCQSAAASYNLACCGYY